MNRRALCLLCSLSFANSEFWNTASVLQPPSIQFIALLNPLSYDGTTCAGRCCKRVEVSRAPDAACTAADWKACARLSRDSIVPRCAAGVPFPCTAWVPCEDDRPAWLQGVLVLFVLTVVILIYPCVKNCIVDGRGDSDGSEYVFKKNFFDLAICVALVTMVVFYAFAIIIASDYEHFAESTEMNLDFISYQHCVEYCNHRIPWDTDAIGVKLNTYQMFYCRDSAYDLKGLDVFPADHNQRPGSSECPTSWRFGIGGSFDGWYCSSCYERRVNWNILRDMSNYNKIRGYLLWSMLLSVAYLGALLDLFYFLGVYGAWETCVWSLIGISLISVLGHCGCFVLDCVFINNFHLYPGVRLTSSVVHRYDAFGFCVGSIFVDLFGILMMIAVCGSCSPVIKWMQQEGYTGVASSGSTVVSSSDSKVVPPSGSKGVAQGAMAMFPRMGQADVFLGKKV